MKNRVLVLLSGLIMTLGLAADDPFFLITTPSQMGETEPFVMKRDLFRFDTAAKVSPDLSMDDPMSPPQKTAEVKAGETPAASSPPAPVVDVVLLGTILRQNKRCALLSINGEIEVVEEGEELPSGWLIERITTTRVTVKTAQSSMMLALEGEEHE